MVYRQMAKRKPVRILEIGLGLAVRTLRMFDVAGRYADPSQIVYTGIDPFESRPAGQPSISMKDAYKLLRQRGGKVKLVPGDALAAMTVTANSLANTDLIVIDGGVSDLELERAWKYFPRMMHAKTLVLRQLPGQTPQPLLSLSAADLQQRIDVSAEQIAKAA